jgi:hypothetical protein
MTIAITITPVHFEVMMPTYMLTVAFLALLNRCFKARIYNFPPAVSGAAFNSYRHCRNLEFYLGNAGPKTEKWQFFWQPTSCGMRHVLSIPFDLAF